MTYKMTRFHLTITIFNSFFEKKLDSRWKINSVWFADYDLFMEKIIGDMDLNDINKFKLNLFEIYKSDLSYVHVSQYLDWDILEWFGIPSYDFNVTSNIIARCLPSRKLRDRYFEWDCLRERYFVKSSFIFYLKSK